MRALRKFRSSDGRIKVATLSGVSALVAVIALLVGVLPVMADHDGDHPLVDPVPLNEGGGSGKCFVETGDLPSIAGNEFHINNPTPGTHTSSDGVVEVNVYGTEEGETPAGRLFEFEVDSGFVVYDVVVNGGPKSLHYDYDANDGPVSSDVDLHAPEKNRHSLHNLSHINICYDVSGLTFFGCDDPVKLTADDGLIDDDGRITVAEATIFANFGVGCTDKQGSFVINTDDTVTLDFGTEDEGFVAGRLDITKDFGAPAAHEDFDDLRYDRDGSGDTFVDVAWCETRQFAEGDGTEFSDWLTTGTEEGSYPKLPAGETACKVAEDEDLTGTQLTVVYFEFVDPNFR